VNSAWFLPHEKQQNAASTKPAAPSLFLVGPTTIMHFFLLNQMMIRVDAGEPHPQPHMSTAVNAHTYKFDYIYIYIYFFFFFMFRVMVINVKILLFSPTCL